MTPHILLGFFASVHPKNELPEPPIYLFSQCLMIEKTRWTILIIFASLPRLNSYVRMHDRCGQGCPGHACDVQLARSPRTCVAIAPTQLRPSRFSRSIYGDPTDLTDDLLQSIRDHGILVPLVIAGEPEAETWEVISGHRRLACALRFGLPKVPCEIRSFRNDHDPSHGDSRV